MSLSTKSTCFLNTSRESDSTLCNLFNYLINCSQESNATSPGDRIYRLRPSLRFYFTLVKQIPEWISLYKLSPTALNALFCRLQLNKNFCKTNPPIPQIVQKIGSLKIQENSVYSTMFLNRSCHCLLQTIFFRCWSAQWLLLNENKAHFSPLQGLKCTHIK